MRVYKMSRRELYERLDKPTLLPLPAERFEYADFVKCTVNIDYHVDVFQHYYSVPYELRVIGKNLEARVTVTTVEILANGRRVTSHTRSFEKFKHTTKPEHMPKAHRAHMEWTPTRMINWARKIGPNTEALVTAILEEKRHPEQGYRSCLGILRLAKRYGDDRLEVACGRALKVRARSYRHVDGILKNGLDRVPEHDAPVKPPILHENIRGGEYYE
jgi:transposase